MDNGENKRNGHFLINQYSKTCLKRPLTKRQKMGFQYQLSLNALQNAPREHSAILLTCIELQHCFKTFVLSIFEWPLKTDFTVVKFTVYR